ncbi:MAG: hypothetical protein O7C63_06395 [Alphaproteobacteria bacterium]|nr:hypothetical protein [Alphaproteobacteria bacterium]
MRPICEALRPANFLVYLILAALGVSIYSAPADAQSARRIYEDLIAGEVRCRPVQVAVLGVLEESRIHVFCRDIVGTAGVGHDPRPGPWPEDGFFFAMGIQPGDSRSDPGQQALSWKKRTIIDLLIAAVRDRGTIAIRYISPLVVPRFAVGTTRAEAENFVCDPTNCEIIPYKGCDPRNCRNILDVFWSTEERGEFNILRLPGFSTEPADPPGARRAPQSGVIVIPGLGTR